MLTLVMTCNEEDARARLSRWHPPDAHERRAGPHRPLVAWVDAEGDTVAAAALAPTCGEDGALLQAWTLVEVWTCPQGPLRLVDELATLVHGWGRKLRVTPVLADALGVPEEPPLGAAVSADLPAPPPPYEEPDRRVWSWDGGAYVLEALGQPSWSQAVRSCGERVKTAERETLHPGATWSSRPAATPTLSRTRSAPFAFAVPPVAGEETSADALAVYAPRHGYRDEDWGIWLLAPRLLAYVEWLAAELAMDPSVAARLVIREVIQHELYHHLEERSFTELERYLDLDGLYEADLRREREHPDDPLSEALATAFGCRRTATLPVEGVSEAERAAYLAHLERSLHRQPPGYRAAGRYSSDAAFAAGERLHLRRATMPRVPRLLEEDQLWPSPTFGVEIVGDGLRPTRFLAEVCPHDLPLHLWGDKAERDALLYLVGDPTAAGWGAWSAPSRLHTAEVCLVRTEVPERLHARREIRGFRALDDTEGREVREIYHLLLDLGFVPRTVHRDGAEAWANGVIRLPNGAMVATPIACPTDLAVNGHDMLVVGIDGALGRVGPGGSFQVVRGPTGELAWHALDGSAACAEP